MRNKFPKVRTFGNLISRILKVQVQKLHTLTGHRDSVYTLQGSSNDSLFFSGSGDGMVVVWDLANPESGSAYR